MVKKLNALECVALRLIFEKPKLFGANYKIRVQHCIVLYCIVLYCKLL